MLSARLLRRRCVWRTFHLRSLSVITSLKSRQGNSSACDKGDSCIPLRNTSRVANQVPLKANSNVPIRRPFAAHLSLFRASKEVLLNPLIISRNDKERVLIETSVNSLRVSIAIKQADEIERILAHKFTRFLTQRAESFVILRRKPIEVRS